MDSKNKIPIIKRTRGYLIYDISGKRYLDFYQDSGRAILGHRLEGMTRVIKSTAARGLIASYPSIYTARMDKQLKLLFPGAKEFRIYSNIDRAMAALSINEGKKILVSDFVDFPTTSCKYAFWRPFLSHSMEWQDSKYFIPILPFPGNFGPVVIAANSSVGDFPPSDSLSPMLCDILIKSTASLIRFLDEADSKKWEVFESPLWEKNGPYLRFKLKGEAYAAFFEKALESGVLLPTGAEIPGIIPMIYEDGQIKDFIRMLRSDYGS